MKYAKQALFLSLVSITFMVLAGCATVPSFDPSLPAVTISRASDTDIRAFGLNFNENPYLEPKTLIRGKLNEFFVAKVQFNLAAAAKIAILAEALSPEGKEAARIYDAQGFAAFWTANTFKDQDNDAQFQRRLTTIERSCVPAMEFTQRAGRTELYLPMVGSNPIPRPANIYIQVTAGQGEAVGYTYVLE